MKRTLILGTLAVALATQGLLAAPIAKGRVPLQRDETYEQNLRWEASADKNITPSKVLRWMMGFRGAALIAPSKTEFQPTVQANNGQVRLVAAIAYKF